MKLSNSSNYLNKKDVRLDLQNFKMNISKTLNSNYLKQFHELNQDMNTKQDNKKTFRKHLSLTPSIPLIVNNKYVSINPKEPDNEKIIDKYNNDFIKSKCQSPFLLRRSIQSSESLNLKTIENHLENFENYSNASSNVSTLRLKDCNLTTDSGLSSLNSGQLFFAEMKEIISKNMEKISTKQSRSNSLASTLRIKHLRFNSFRNLLTKKTNSDKYLSSPFLLSISKLDDAQKMQHPLENANLEALEYLLQLKRDDNVPISQIVDQDGNTLLHKAIIYNQYDIVRYLIKNHLILINCKNNFDLYPIHICVLKGDMPVLRLVARESKKHINKRDASDMTPSMHAAIEGKYEALKYLLDNAGAKYNKVTKKEKFSLLHLGVQSGSIDVVQYLLFKMGPSYLKFRTKDGATVFHIAAARGHDQILEYLLALKSAKYLKNSKDIWGSTPAHDAAENGHLKCLKLLNDAGLNMYEEDVENMTPYELALSSNNVECKNFVLECLKPAQQLEEKDLKSSTSNNSLNQTSATNRKINLRRIGSMLRLKRAKDINHEPAYLYRQKFRPAPVSLPEQSKITSFKNEPVAQTENEDDLNDSVIDELINHVQNSSVKHSEKTSNKVVSQISRKQFCEEKDYESASKSSSRASRYDKHRVFQQNEITVQNNDKKTNSPPKKSETSNLGIILRNSLSSSRETTPTIIRLSRSGTPTPLLQSVTQTRTNVLENENSEYSTKINLLNQKRVSTKDKNSSPNPEISKQSLAKSKSDNSNFTKMHNELSIRRFSLSKDEKKTQETKMRRQSLNNNNFAKISNLDFDQANQASKIFEPEPDYWDVPYNNNINHISKANITIEQIKQTDQEAVSVAKVILKNVKESVKRSDSKRFNENIIVSETIHIISDHKEIKSVESANQNNFESFYNLIEDDQTEFKTSLKVESMTDQSASFVSGFDDFPQPPSQSFLKMSQMECSEFDLSPVNTAHLPLPPPPPPLPDPPQAITLNLNTETLLLAKKNLKIKSNNSESKQKDSSKLIENQDLKKNFFLLQEIQNHRLYNTKKDYVLDYLDRGTNLIPSVSYSPSSSGSTLGKSQSINRSLSNSDLNKTEDSQRINKSPPCRKSEQNFVSQTQLTPVSNYERFPYLKNKNLTNNNNKFYPCGSYLPNKRTQSSNPINRNSLGISQSVNGRSLSVEREGKVDQNNKLSNESSNNNSCIIIINKEEKIDKQINQSEEKNENVNLLNVKKFRQIIPQEKIESELDRVFRRRALINNI